MRLVLKLLANVLDAGVPTWAIAGIVLGLVVLVASAIGVGWLLVRHPPAAPLPTPSGGPSLRALAPSDVLHVVTRFDGRAVDERFLRIGRPLRVGSDGDAASAHDTASTVQVPVSGGGRYVARVSWRGRTCLVEDAAGQVREVGADGLAFEDGHLRVTMRLGRRLALPVFDWPTVGAGLAWAVVVLLSTLVSSQVVWFAENFCAGAVAVLPSVPEVGGPLLWLSLPASGAAVAIVALVVANQWRSVAPALVAPILGLVVPALWQLGGVHWRSGSELLANELQACVPKPPGGGASGGFGAEYLARLLRKDYDGAERGVIEDRIERPQAERVVDEKHIYMPAGSVGPATEMGGAAERSLRPVRTVVVEAEPTLPQQKKVKKEEVVPVPGEAPVPTVVPSEDGRDDEVAEGLDVEERPEDEGSEPPSEEKVGWGIPGWYDEEDRQMENLEIELVLRMAKRRVAIDPNDTGALGILSYYQYLAQDYKSALRTYDKILSLDPEDAAAYNNKALVYKRLEDYKKEEGLYRQSLNLEPDDTTALNNLAVNLAHQGRYEEALAIMKELETTDPDDPYADLHRSKIYAQMGRDEEAYRYLERALSAMQALDTLHHIEFRQDIRIDPAFENLRQAGRFQSILLKYYGKDTPLQDGR